MARLKNNTSIASSFIRIYLKISLIFLIVCVLPFLLYFSYQHFSAKLNEVRLEGRIRTDMKELTEAINVKYGQPMHKISKNDIQHSILKLPWIKNVSIKQEGKNALVISLTEKVPIAVWKNDEKYLPLDENADPIQDEKARIEDLIVIVGHDAPKHALNLLKKLSQYPMVYKRVKSATWIEDNWVGNWRWRLILDKADGKVVEILDGKIDEGLAQLKAQMEESIRLYHSCIQLIRKECANNFCFLSENEVLKIPGVNDYCLKFEEEIVIKKRTPNPYYFYAQAIGAGYCPYY